MTSSREESVAASSRASEGDRRRPPRTSKAAYRPARPEGCPTRRAEIHQAPTRSGKPFWPRVTQGQNGTGPVCHKANRAVTVCHKARMFCPWVPLPKHTAPGPSRDYLGSGGRPSRDKRDHPHPVNTTRPVGVADTRVRGASPREKRDDPWRCVRSAGVVGVSWARRDLNPHTLSGTRT